jgi:hypothetical protein
LGKRHNRSRWPSAGMHVPKWIAGRARRLSFHLNEAFSDRRGQIRPLRGL